MSVTTAMKHAQKAAERLIVYTCTIARLDPDSIDPLTGEALSVDVYDGKCRVQVTSAQATNGESIGHTFTEQDYQLHIPASVESPKVGDVVTLTATPSKPSRAGKVFRVEALFEKTFQSAQRIKISSST